eukprot:3660257-Prymnesium_polylepis.1
MAPSNPALDYGVHENVAFQTINRTGAPDPSRGDVFHPVPKYLGLPMLAFSLGAPRSPVARHAYTPSLRLPTSYQPRRRRTPTPCCAPPSYRAH